jgi:type I restriction enzyme S subunit
VLASSLGLRLDATYHSTIALEAEEKIAKCNCLRSLKDVVVRMFKPPMFKRLWVSGPEFGRRFVSGESICRLRPTENQYVSTRTPQFSEFILKRGWLIFQAAGQVYGLFGQPIWVSGWLEEVFCADDVYRVVPVDEIDGAYLYVWFRTPHGRALLVRQASGNSIPRVWDPHMARVSVPWADRRVREEFGERVVSAHRMLEVAACNEDHAVKLVEAWLEKE